MRDASNANTGSIIPIDVVKARLSGQRVMVMEEDAATFGRIFMSLTAADCRATLARRRLQAFQVAERSRPTLVIFSTAFAGATAPELIADLRASPFTADAILVALADEESKRERRRLFALGCDGYLWKPADRYLFAVELLQRTPRLMGVESAKSANAAKAAKVAKAAKGVRDEMKRVRSRAMPSHERGQPESMRVEGRT